MNKNMRTLSGERNIFLVVYNKLALEYSALRKNPEILYLEQAPEVAGLRLSLSGTGVFL